MFNVSTSKRIGQRANVRVVGGSIVRLDQRRERAMLALHIAGFQTQPAMDRFQQNIARRASGVIAQSLLEPLVEFEWQPERPHRPELSRTSRA
jgi:hypothetical protein